jgi:hypothetical protein
MFAAMRLASIKGERVGGFSIARPDVRDALLIDVHDHDLEAGRYRLDDPRRK